MPPPSRGEVQTSIHPPPLWPTSEVGTQLCPRGQLFHIEARGFPLSIATTPFSASCHALLASVFCLICSYSLRYYSSPRCCQVLSSILLSWPLNRFMSCLSSIISSRCNHHQVTESRCCHRQLPVTSSLECAYEPALTLLALCWRVLWCGLFWSTPTTRPACLPPFFSISRSAGRRDICLESCLV